MAGIESSHGVLGAALDRLNDAVRAPDLPQKTTVLNSIALLWSSSTRPQRNCGPAGKWAERADIAWLNCPQTMDCTTPPSTRSAAPVVAEAWGEQT
jgi:hypothetical protein